MTNIQVRKLATLSFTAILSLACVVALLWLLSYSPKVVLAQAGTGIIRVAITGSDTLDCGSQTTPCRTVQRAVDMAVSGDEIRVASGVYTDVNNYGGLAQVVYISKTITIRGGYTTTDWTTPFPITQPTTLDAQDQGRVLYVEGYISPTIEGLRLFNGNAKGLGGTSFNADAGGGAYIAAFGVKLQDCWIANNTAEFGAGAYQLYDGPTTLNNNVFSANYGQMGGGAFLEASTATLNDNVFIDNSANGGGGLALYQSSATLNDNIIVNNVAHWAGGVSLYSSSATLNNNTIIGNVAVEGGGLHISDSAPVLDGNLIKANTARLGGGLCLESSDGALLVNNTIAENKPDGLTVQGSSPRLVHNTLAYNVDEFGYGIAVIDAYGDYSTVALTNTILVGHSVGIRVDAGNVATLEATLWGNTNDWMGPGTIVTGTRNYWGLPILST